MINDLQGSNESVDIAGACCPTGDEAAIHQVSHGIPLLKDKIFLQSCNGLLVQQDKLLIGWGITVHLIPFGNECFTQAHGLLNGMACDFEEKVILHQRVKLDTQQASLGQQGPMLLDDGEKMFWCRSVRIGKYHSLATQGPTLGAASVKHVAQVGQLAQTGSIDEKRQIIVPAHIADGL